MIESVAEHQRQQRHYNHHEHELLVLARFPKDDELGSEDQ